MLDFCMDPLCGGKWFGQQHLGVRLFSSLWSVSCDHFVHGRKRFGGAKKAASEKSKVLESLC